MVPQECLSLQQRLSLFEFLFVLFISSPYFVLYVFVRQIYGVGGGGIFILLISTFTFYFYYWRRQTRHSPLAEEEETGVLGREEALQKEEKILTRHHGECKIAP